MKDIQFYQTALERLASFVRSYDSVINACMVDFVIKDLYNTSIPKSVGENLLKLSEDQLLQLPSKLIRGEESDSDLGQILAEVRAHTLDGLEVIQTRKEFECDLKSSENELLHHFDRIMGEKKMHEVMVMSGAVSRLAEDLEIGHLVDLGSGKGYLSGMLASLPSHDDRKLRVLAVDSQEGNTEGATKRSKNLERKWNALFRRAQLRAKGLEPPSRGKNWKSKELKQNGELQSQPPDVDEVNDEESLKHITKFVDTDTDIPSILSDTFEENTRPQFGVIGLHTCGNLAPNSLRIFLSSQASKFIVNVGCCYHHLWEEFYRNPYLNDEENDKYTSQPAFPLSKLLKKSRFELGRNARMLAAQPMDRMASNQQLPAPSLLWRAILQHILLEIKPDLSFADQQVGRIGSKCDNFTVYCRKAFDKIGISQTEKSDKELADIFAEFSGKFAHKLNAFYQFRSLFAPLVEGVILLDRLVYLLEQHETVRKATLVKLFDPVVSPRCYALVAIKKGL